MPAGYIAHLAARCHPRCPRCQPVPPIRSGPLAGAGAAGRPRARRPGPPYPARGRDRVVSWVTPRSLATSGCHGH